MPIFVYTAKDSQSKPSKGTVEAANEKEAANLIRERSLFITSLTAKKERMLVFSFQKFQKISETDIVSFTRQLATMITAGLPIQDALALLKNQTSNQTFASLLGQISRDIHAGQTLAVALSNNPKQFSPTYLALIKAGESSGTLERVMERLADNLEKDQDFKNRVKGAMIYPTIIMIAMVVVFFLLMTLVVPRLTQLYEDFGSDLPWSTQLLKSISDLVLKSWWLVIGVVGGGIYLFKKWLTTSSGEAMWDGFNLRLPILGPLKKQIMLVEFTRTLGMLTSAGVHILDSLNILVDSMENAVFRDTLKEIVTRVEKGFPLGELFAQFPIYPPILGQMVKVGEETGKIDESLLKLSTYFERESDHTVKKLTTSIEPLIMIVLGVGVGFIVFSIITPIYNLTSQFK